MLVPVTLGMLHGVLEEEGHAGERTVMHHGSFLAGPFETPEHQRVDGRVEPFDPFDGQFGQFGGRNLTGTHQLRLTYGVDPVQFVAGHHAPPPVEPIRAHRSGAAPAPVLSQP